MIKSRSCWFAVLLLARVCAFAAEPADAPPADLVKFAGLEPQAAAEAITLPPGFSAKLFAGEPDVQQPIAFAIDDRGRLWVAEGFTYPRRAPEGEGKDRILILEDTDGDHRFDRRTAFAEKLNLISGLEVGFGGVWIGAAPHLMFIPDKNRDDKPDGPPQILLDGWDYLRDTHETLNTFTWGPDGWLYGCHGVFCPSFVGKPGTPNTERQRVDAAVWRFHPLQHRFEVFAEGTSNPWGIDFDEHGQCFIEACVIPHLWHMIQGARYERQGGQHYNINAAEQRAHDRYHSQPNQRFVHPFIFDDIKTIADHVHWAGSRGPHAANARSDAMGGGHAHAGLMVYLGDSWPAEYRNRLFMNNIHGQRINMDVVERRGSGYTGRHGRDFLNFNDKWSQVLNLLYDHNGSVYLIDWYDKNQCHHNDVNGHDRSNGRIFKVVYGDQKPTPVDLAAKSSAELVALQRHPNDWHVRHARRLLQERGPDPAVHKALRALLTKQAEPARRLRVLWALHVTGGLPEALALAQLRDPSEFVRAWAIQLLAETPPVSSAARDAFLHAARNDASPLVRLYVASATQRLPLDQRWELVAALQAHASDAADHNLPLMTWFALEGLVGADPDRALALARKGSFPRLLNFTVRRLAADGPARLPAVVRALTDESDEHRQFEMLEGLQLALKSSRALAMPERWPEVEGRFARHPNAQLRLRVQALSLFFGNPQAAAGLRETVVDARVVLPLRQFALETLLAAKDAGLAATLRELLRDPPLRAAALRALAGYDDPTTPPVILGIYPQLTRAEQRDALNTLAAREAFARPLLAAVDRGEIPKNALTADLVRQLRSLKHPGINEQLEKVWGVTRESSADQRKEIERYRRIYQAGGSQPGEASRGRAVYQRICHQCHVLFDTGGKVGPDLTGSNRGDLEYILQNMIDPNAVIPNDYRASTLTTKDQRVITGIVKQEDAQSVTIATANETLTVPRAEIESLQLSQVSMMPEGLLTPLADQEVRDLIYYLTRPGQVPLP